MLTVSTISGLTVSVLAEWDSDCAGECLSLCQQEWRDVFLQTIFVSYHLIWVHVPVPVYRAFSSVYLPWQAPARATADQLQLLRLVSHANMWRCTYTQYYYYAIKHCFSSMNEESMRVNLVSYSPLTTSVNAITWQDYIGTYYNIMLNTIYMCCVSVSITAPRSCVCYPS